MNLLLLFPGDFEGPNRARLDDRRARHVLEVLNASVGDTLAVGRLNGPLGHGRITCLAPLRFDIRWDSEPPRPEVTVVLAMVRPQVMKRTLTHLASLGIRRLCLIGSRRVEKAYFSQRLFDNDGYREHLLLGLEQAKDTWLPEVTIHRRFRPFVEDVLPGLAQSAANRWIAHPDPVVSGANPPDAPEGGTILAIGPEGGWIPFEVDAFTDNGFVPLSLGPRILRVETAIPYLFGCLALSGRR